MGYFELFCWSNYPDRDRLAIEYYQKAKAGVDVLDVNTDVAFCLVRNEASVISVELTKLECIRQPLKSFQGKQPGVWRTDWPAPSAAQSSFKSPAVVTVKTQGRSVTNIE